MEQKHQGSQKQIISQKILHIKNILIITKVIILLIIIILPKQRLNLKKFLLIISYYEVLLNIINYY